MKLVTQAHHYLPCWSHQWYYKSCSLCSCSVDARQHRGTKRNARHQWKGLQNITKKPQKPLAISDRVYLQTRSTAWGVRLGQSRPNWRDTRRRGRGTRVTQRPARLRGRRRRSWDPGSVARRVGGWWWWWKRFIGGKKWRSTSSPIGEIGEKCPDFIIQLSDITLRGKGCVPETETIGNHRNDVHHSKRRGGISCHARLSWQSIKINKSDETIVWIWTVTT